MKHRLFPLEELPPGQMRAVRVAGRPLVIIHTEDGAMSALRDTCPHYGPPLSLGSLGPLLMSDDPGHYAIAEGRFVIRCPRHGYEFDVASGVCPADESVRVRIYPIEIEDGAVVVHM